MKKKIRGTLFILCFLFSLEYCKSQDSILPRAHLGAGVSSLGDNRYFNYGSKINPFVSINFRSHVIGAGLMFDPDNGGNGDSTKTYPSVLTGAHAFYRYFPYKRHRRIDFFFEYNFLFRHSHSESSFTLSYFNISQEEKITNFSNYAGCGFVLNISNKIFLFESSGFGYSITRGFNQRYFNNTSYEKTSYDTNKFNIYIKAGIGIDFNTTLITRK